jgi:hypothetical protein
MRTNLEKLLSVFPISKSFGFLVATVAAECQVEDDFAVNDIPQRFPWHRFRARLSIKHSALISAEWTRIFDYVTTTLLVGTGKSQFAWPTMTAFRRVAEPSHGITAHVRFVVMHAALI